MKTLLITLVSGPLIACTALLSWAQEIDTSASPRSLVAIDLFCGFGMGEVSDKDDAHIYPVTVGLDFDLRPWADHINIHPPGLLRLRIEPFFSFLPEPAPNIETGAALLLKIGFLPETSRFQPYFLAGPGIAYMTLQTREQKTQLNFIEYGSLGAHYFLNKHWAVTGECRYRHLSNADLATPNKGMESTFILLGVTYRF